MNFNFLKREKGSITVYVLVALLFILAIVFGRYLLANRQLETQLTGLKQMKQLYGSDVREYSSGETIIDDGPTDPGDDPGMEQVEIPTDTSNIVPIYNTATLEYFLSNNGPYYIYQEGKNYVTTADKTFILKCDIIINKNRSDILISSGYNIYSFYGSYQTLNNKLNFNNYCIRTKDAIIFYYSNRIRVKTL